MTGLENVGENTGVEVEGAAYSLAHSGLGGLDVGGLGLGGDPVGGEGLGGVGFGPEPIITSA